MMFIKLTLTPFQESRLETKELWINSKEISCMAEYETHTALYTPSGVYGVMEKPEEIFDMLKMINNDSV